MGSQWAGSGACWRLHGPWAMSTYAGVGANTPPAPGRRGAASVTTAGAGFPGPDGRRCLQREHTSGHRAEVPEGVIFRGLLTFLSSHLRAGRLSAGEALSLHPLDVSPSCPLTPRPRTNLSRFQNCAKIYITYNLTLDPVLSEQTAQAP